MSVSLNEVEVTAKKATRGAGYSWGLAEEAGKAARWLCAHGLDGSAIVARALAHGPVDHDAGWPEGESHCALAGGASLADFAHVLRDGPLTLRTVSEPLLTLPFAALAAGRLGTPLTISCGGATAVTDGTGLNLSGPFPEAPADVSVTVGGTLDAPLPTQSRSVPDPAAWDQLNQLAARTYAPATEESRLLGAGAGLSDND